MCFECDTLLSPQINNGLFWLDYTGEKKSCKQSLFFLFIYSFIFNILVSSEKLLSFHFKLAIIV